MSLRETLMNRSRACCELCASTLDLDIYEVHPLKKVDANTAILVCSKCKTQIEFSSTLEANHWRCLNESMWSEQAPVKVMAYRLLTRLKNESWAQDLLEQIYLDEPLLEWAQAGLQEEEPDSLAPTLDSHGTRLLDGDSVTLIKDLEVKGGGFTAKRGTLVKNIALSNNPKHVEGKVNGIQIVLVANFLKKA